jgi:hypothetical protein
MVKGNIMENQIKDLIYSIASGDAAETENKLNAIMSQKAMAALDDMRINVSNSMFSQQVQSEE